MTLATTTLCRALCTDGRQLRTVAEVAISRVSELEAEVASLRAACQQRQEVIALLRGRA